MTRSTTSVGEPVAAGLKADWPRLVSSAPGLHNVSHMPAMVIDLRIITPIPFQMLALIFESSVEFLVIFWRVFEVVLLRNMSDHSK